METTKNETGTREVETLDVLTRESIVSQLREAVALAENDFEASVDPFREILSDVLDRTDAWVLVKAIDGAAESTRAVFPMACARTDDPAGEPVSEWLLIPLGEVVVERPASGESFAFTLKHAESAKSWFERMGRKLAIDYEHQSFDRFNTRADGLRPAAGWIGGLEVRDDGLWAVDVVWTERARQLLRSGEYKYFSPVIYWTDEDHGDVAALGPVALTNDPAMRGVRPLAASKVAEWQGDKATKPQGREAEMEDHLSGEPSRAAGGSRHELEEAHAEVAMLKRQLTAQEADTFVERGMRTGKILDSSSMDWRTDYLRDPELAEERLSRAPVLLPPGRMVTLDRRGEPVGTSRAERMFARDAEAYRQIGVDAEDLEAFERALAAGRVRGLPLSG